MLAALAYLENEDRLCRAANDNAAPSARAKLKFRLAAERRFDSQDQIPRYVYDASRKLVHVEDKNPKDGGAAERTDYMSVAGMDIARVITGQGIYYQHTDHLGSTVATTTSSGFLTAKERYTPFGETLDNPGLLSDQGGFTGHIKDSATGLNPAFFASENCKVQARYYDPVIGRFLSVDPVTFLDKPYPGQFNRYTYTWNDPINANDPDGEFLNFVAKFVVDVGLEVALQVATGQDIDIGAATKDAAIGLLDPTKTAKKVAALGAIGGAALVARKARKTCCFVAGTLVETEFGLRPIEEIEVDDLVWARDGETGVEALKPVLGLIRLHDRVIWDLETISETGEAHTFGTTDDHPWWVDGHGWKRTDELSPKDILVTQTGEKVSILSVTNTNLVKPTFNFEVADFNTYFVGESKVWVHNAACDLKGSYVRFGDGPETIDTLTEQAGKAKAAGFGHGVSVKHTKRVSGSDNAHRSATVDDVGSNFNVRNTGNNPNHRTVDINEPVTQSDVDKFNETFPPK